MLAGRSLDHDRSFRYQLEAVRLCNQRDYRQRRHQANDRDAEQRLETALGVRLVHLRPIRPFQRPAERRAGP